MFLRRKFGGGEAWPFLAVGGGKMSRGKGGASTGLLIYFRNFPFFALCCKSLYWQNEDTSLLAQSIQRWAEQKWRFAFPSFFLKIFEWYSQDRFFFSGKEIPNGQYLRYDLGLLVATTQKTTFILGCSRHDVQFFIAESCCDSQCHHHTNCFGAKYQFWTELKVFPRFLLPEKRKRKTVKTVRLFVVQENRKQKNGGNGKKKVNRGTLSTPSGINILHENNL